MWRLVRGRDVAASQEGGGRTRASAAEGSSGERGVPTPLPEDTL